MARWHARDLESRRHHPCVVMTALAYQGQVVDFNAPREAFGASISLHGHASRIKAACTGHMTQGSWAIVKSEIAAAREQLRRLEQAGRDARRERR